MDNQYTLSQLHIQRRMEEAQNYRKAKAAQNGKKANWFNRILRRS